MTDEEKAEEYVNSNGFGSDYNNIDSYTANEEIRQAFLAGLAEGRFRNRNNITGDYIEVEE